MHQKVTHIINYVESVLFGLSYLLVLIIGLNNASNSGTFEQIIAGVLYVFAAIIILTVAVFGYLKNSEIDYENQEIVATVFSNIGQGASFISIIVAHVYATLQDNAFGNLVPGFLILSLGLVIYFVFNLGFWQDSDTKLSNIFGYLSSDNDYSSSNDYSTSQNKIDEEKLKELRKKEEEIRRQKEQQREKEAYERDRHFYHTGTKIEQRRISAEYSSPILGAPVCDYQIDITFTFKTASGRVQTKTASKRVNCESVNSYYYHESNAEYEFSYMLDDYYAY